MPDPLEAERDAYAQQHSQPVSQVVAEALLRFLRETPPEPSPPKEGLVVTQEYREFPASVLGSARGLRVAS